MLRYVGQHCNSLIKIAGEMASKSQLRLILVASYEPLDSALKIKRKIKT